MKIRITFEICVIWDIIIRTMCSARKGWRHGLCISVTIKAIFVITAAATMEIVDDRIPCVYVSRIIGKGRKDPESPIDTKLLAVMNHIRKGKENDARKGQNQEQEEPVPNNHFIHA